MSCNAIHYDMSDWKLQKQFDLGIFSKCSSNWPILSNSTLFYRLCCTCLPAPGTLLLNFGVLLPAAKVPKSLDTTNGKAFGFYQCLLEFIEKLNFSDFWGKSIKYAQGFFLRELCARQVWMLSGLKVEPNYRQSPINCTKKMEMLDNFFF